MLELKDFMPVNYLKKEKFTGSHCGMRFRMEKVDREGEGTLLGVSAWPEPYGYDATPDSQKLRTEFSFDADGIAKSVDWLNEQYVGYPEKWKR